MTQLFCTKTMYLFICLCFYYIDIMLGSIDSYDCIACIIRNGDSV